MYRDFSGTLELKPDGFFLSKQKQSQNVYKNRDSCLVVLVDLFAQTERASNVFKNYPGLEDRGRFLV